MDGALNGERAVAAESPLDPERPVARLSRLDVVRESRSWRFIRGHGILVAFGLLLVAGALLSPYFLTPANAGNVARQASIIGILGVGMTFVILTAGIDLSAGSILGFSAIAFAMAVTSGIVWPLAIVVALLAGASVGAINGLGVTRGHLQPFIMTLGMLVIARGVTMTIASGKPIPLGEAGREVAWLGSGDVLGVPVPVLLFALIAAAAWLTLRYTPFGRHVYAVGDNLEAARLSGIPTDRTIFAVYVISGLCAAVSALLVVSRLTAGEPSQGTGYELDAIAIVVIGGTSLFGGEGGIGGTVIGAAIVATMNNLLNLLGVSPFSQQIVKGLIILGAVYLERRSVKAEGR